MVSIYKQNNNLLTGSVTNNYFSIKPFYSKKRTISRLSIFENSKYFLKKYRFYILHKNAQINHLCIFYDTIKILFKRYFIYFRLIMVIKIILIKTLKNAQIIYLCNFGQPRIKIINSGLSKINIFIQLFFTSYMVIE